MNEAADRYSPEIAEAFQKTLTDRPATKKSDAVRALREFDGDPEGMTEIYLTGKDDVLDGVVPLARLILALPETRVAVLSEPRIISCLAEAHQDEVAELFDKYNLHALPVVNAANRLVGVVQADHVIAFLRAKQ